MALNSGTLDWECSVSTCELPLLGTFVRINKQSNTRTALNSWDPATQGCKGFKGSTNLWKKTFFPSGRIILLPQFFCIINNDTLSTVFLSCHVHVSE